VNIHITKDGAVKVDDRVVGMVRNVPLQGWVYKHYRFGMRETDPMKDYDQFLDKLTGFLQKSFA
jgi:hypothetical protein